MKLTDAIIALINRATSRALRKTLAENAASEGVGAKAAKPELPSATNPGSDPIWRIVAQQRQKEEAEHRKAAARQGFDNSPRSWAEAFAGDVGHKLYEAVVRMKDRAKGVVTSPFVQSQSTTQQKKSGSPAPAKSQQNSGNQSLWGRTKDTVAYYATGVKWAAEDAYDAVRDRFKSRSGGSSAPPSGGTKPKVNYSSMMANMGNPNEARDAKAEAIGRARAKDANEQKEGKGLISLLSNFGKIGKISIAFAAALGGGLWALKRWTDGLVSSRAELARYNGGIASSMAQLRSQDVRLKVQSGLRTEDSNRQLLKAVMDFRESFQPIADTFTVISNSVFIPILRGVNKIVDMIAEALGRGDGPNDGIRNIDKIRDIENIVRLQNQRFPGNRKREPLKPLD